MGLFDAIAQGISGAIEAGIEAREEERVLQSQDRKRESETNLIEERYQAFLVKERKAYEEEQVDKKIAMTWNVAFEEGMVPDDDWFESVFSTLPPEIRNSSKFKASLEIQYEKKLHDAVEQFLAGQATPEMLMIYLKPFRAFPKYRKIVDHSLTHWDYYLEDRGAEKSILTDKRMYEFLDAILAGEVVQIPGIIFELNAFSMVPTKQGLEDFFKFTDKYDKPVFTHEELFKQGKYQEAFDQIVSADRTEEELESMKVAVIAAAGFEADHQLSIDTYELAKRACESIFRKLGDETDGSGRKSLKIVQPIDVVVAQAIRLNRTNMIDGINDDLTDFIDELISHYELNKGFAASEQMGILAEVFAYLKAYKQESIVLEAMVANGVPRTEQQEARLSFLRNGGGSRAESFAPKTIEFADDNDDTLAFDYRSMSWSENDLKSYFDMLSGTKKLPNAPLVVAEWVKNIDANGIEWHPENVINQVANAISSNLGDELIVKLINAGIILEGDTDYIPAIVLNDNGKGKYPWLGFVLMGDQVTKKQIALSIYALYYPENDFSGEDSIYERNNKSLTRMLTLTKKQNPRINNYISTIESLLVDTLENWFNKDSNDDDIY